VAVTEVVVSEVIRQKLGDDGLSDLAACLWAVDCQTCGRLLGDDPPVLCVDDLTVFAVASLHHQQCRTPEWNDSMVIRAGSGDYLSFVARMVLLPLASEDGEEELWPMLVVNPGLECVPLERARDGKWRAGANPEFAGAGLVRPGPELRLGEPVEGAVARVMDSSVTVVLQVPPFAVYEAPADERILDCARARGGVLIGVTQKLHPGNFDLDDLRETLADPRTLAGWVGLHGSAPRPRRRARARGEVCVLHWNSDHLSVGKLVRQAPRRFSSYRARSWAERVIGPDQGVPLVWRPAQEGCPDEGWYVQKPSSMQRYFLRLHADRWRLVQAYSCTSGTRAETDNEARAWAADVLKFQAGISGLAWKPGPSTPGSVTLYALA
jgi:hypothetical protein